MKSKARRLIEQFALGKKLQPHYLGTGLIFLVPSDSDLGGYYVVAQVSRKSGGRVYKEWVCQCKSFRFDTEDRCKHIRNISTQLEALRRSV